MRIQFCGADRTVTGSCHLIEVNGLRILLDVGMFQGSREIARRINTFLPSGAKDADCVILSHGHLDHCGKLPFLTRAGFSGPVYCTPASAAVARIVLEDSAEIQEEDADYLNRRQREPGQEPIIPLYTRADLPRLFKLFRTVPYHTRTELGNGVAFTFFDAGHILGSAYVILEWTEGAQKRSLLFTADIGRYGTPILRDPDPLTGPVDILITESTYGNAMHAPMDQVGPQLLDTVKQVIRDNARLLIPAFAVGRTQTLLWYMQKFISEGAIPRIPIFVDSPMGVEVSHVHTDFRENYDAETLALIGQKDLFGISRVTFAVSSQESRKINGYTGACVIIASSPTCEFGRILHHLKQSLENPKDVIVFVGWTPYNTLGRRLQDKQTRVRIYDRWYDVKCQTKTIHGLSAHADADELIRFLTPTLSSQTTAYIVHGEEEQSESFASRLLSAGIARATVPAMETSFIAYTAPPPAASPKPAMHVKAED